MPENIECPDCNQPEVDCTCCDSAWECWADSHEAQQDEYYE